MPNLTFYTNPMSRGRIARWMLEEIGAPYETILLDYGTTMKSPDYLAINPMGKVPAVTHNGVTITENAAICAYLADAFPSANLAPPPNSPARAPYYRWFFFTAGPYEAAVTNHTFKFNLPPGREMSAGYGSYAAILDTLEKTLLAASYLAGDAFTAADLYLAAQLNFGLRFKTIEPRPAFLDYVTRHTARPAYRRATEIDDSLMPKTS
jgi:glutathione S-transferase